MLAGLSLMEVFGLACLGIALDLLLGEPRRWHPLMGFGRLVGRLEARLNKDPPGGRLKRRGSGMVAMCILVAPPVALVAGLAGTMLVPWWAVAFVHVASLYFGLGAKSLWEHLRPVAAALAAADLPLARSLTARIVSRDTQSASVGELAKAAVESTLENGNDAIFAALFWFIVAGAPGVVAFRLVNTLDAMWGYKTPRFIYFGWASARLDDALNFVPARLTALTYALIGNTCASLSCWFSQARGWESPNAGPVMAAGAGALGVQLGGPAWYHGKIEQRPPLGMGREPCAADVDRSLALVGAGIAGWLALLALLVFSQWLTFHA